MLERGWDVTIFGFEVELSKVVPKCLSVELGHDDPGVARGFLRCKLLFRAGHGRGSRSGGRRARLEYTYT